MEAHAHDHHEMPASGRELNGVALSATLHCLTGCAIGEVLGMVIGTALGFSDWGTVALAVALVRVGEETGLVDEMLLKVAAYFESDVEAAIATLGAVIEPALIAGLGGIVGFIVFSVFIPLYALIGEVSK